MGEFIFGQKRRGHRFQMSSYRILFNVGFPKLYKKLSGLKNDYLKFGREICPMYHVMKLLFTV